MRIIQQNTVAFLERMGKFQRRLDPGLHFFVPVVDRITDSISLKENVVDVAHQDVITKDNVRVAIDGYFFYKVVDPFKATYDVEQYDAAIRSLSTSVSRSEIGKVTLDEIFQHREDLNEKIKSALNESAHEWGIECLNYEIIRLDPPVEVQQAMTQVATSERRRRQQVIRSEADREFLERKSAAEMNAGVLIEGARLEAVTIWNEDFRKGLENIQKELDTAHDPKRLLDYLLTEEYLGRLEQILKSKKVVVLPEDHTAGNSADNLLSLSYIMSNLRAPLDPSSIMPQRPKEFKSKKSREAQSVAGKDSQSMADGPSERLADDIRSSSPWINS